MSTADDTREASEDEQFVRRTKELFDQSVNDLDGQSRSRLNRGRQAALAELPAAVSGRWSQWLPASGAAAAVLVAVTLWYGNVPEVHEPLPAMVDFELLMAEDSFEMLQDLEFYSWLDIDSEQDKETGAVADVG